MNAIPWTCEPVRAPEALSRPDFELPRGACDSHMHVFGDRAVYPPVDDARYDWPGATLEQYLRVMSRLGVSRLVLVQPSYYGLDNRCLFEAMRQVGGACRGVVFAPEAPTASELDDLAARGITGLRLDLFKLSEGGADRDAMARRVRAAAAAAASMGWHIELYSPGPVTFALIDVLAALPTPVSVNHFGYMSPADGMANEHFAAFLQLVRNADCWVKLTAPYRLKPESDSRTSWMAQELIDAAPDRIVWGTDWPHIPQGGLDTGAITSRLAAWCPDVAQRRAILVDNPARLYGFP